MTVTPPDLITLPAPLVIGVTGHRDLRPEDAEKLEIKVQEIFIGLQKQYPSTPIVLLSALAEGADRLVARVALDAGAELVVPLPMARHIYEQDFNTPELLADFHHLLKRAKHSFTITRQADEAELAHPGPARDHQYEEMGKYIARESLILIALWDGVKSSKVGGTAGVVRFQLEGMRKPADCDLQPPELFPVYHIVTPRKSNPIPEGEPFQLNRKYPQGFRNDEEAQKYYDKSFRNLDDFNHSIRRGGDSLIAQATESKKDLLNGFNEADLTPSEILDLDRYAVSDALARLFQRKMLWMDKALHWLVFLGFTFFALFAHLPTNSWISLVLSVVLLAVTWQLYRKCARDGLDTKNQDYRAIAEACRVRFFWHLAGVHDSVADNYLGKQRTELDWIRNGLRAWRLRTYLAPTSVELNRKDYLKAVQRLWLGAQLKYFKWATEANEKRLKRMENWKHLCFWSFLLTAAAMFVAVMIHQFLPNYCRHPHTDYEEPPWLSPMIILVDLFLVAGALFHHYIQQRAFTQHIKQFRRMETVFGLAQEFLHQRLDADDLAGARQCLRKLGQEALSENGDWVLLHRERPMEFPPP
jgi:hypothetical protein